MPSIDELCPYCLSGNVTRGRSESVVVIWLNVYFSCNDCGGSFRYKYRPPKQEPVDVVKLAEGHIRIKWQDDRGEPAPPPDVRMVSRDLRKWTR